VWPQSNQEGCAGTPKAVSELGGQNAVRLYWKETASVFGIDAHHILPTRLPELTTVATRFKRNGKLRCEGQKRPEREPIQCSIPLIGAQ